MKSIYYLFSLLFFICINLLIISNYAIALGNVDWILLKENNEGKEWLDMGSIKIINDKEISVLTRFYKSPKESNNNGETILYVMKINCNEKTFKDTSRNGIPQFNSKWHDSDNDEFIDVVIEKSCYESINK